MEPENDGDPVKGVVKMKLTPNKPNSIHLRLDDQSYAFVRDFGALVGLSPADTIRMMIGTIKSATIAQDKDILVKMATLSALGDLGRSSNENKPNNQ